MGGWGIEEAEGIGRQKGHGTAGRRSGTEEGRDSRESAYPEGRRKTVKVAAEMLINTAHSASSSASVQAENHSSLRAISQLIYSITWKLDILLA